MGLVTSFYQNRYSSLRNHQQQLDPAIQPIRLQTFSSTTTPVFTCSSVVKKQEEEKSTEEKEKHENNPFKTALDKSTAIIILGEDSIKQSIYSRHVTRAFLQEWWTYSQADCNLDEDWFKKHILCFFHRHAVMNISSSQQRSVVSVVSTGWDDIGESLKTFMYDCLWQPPETVKIRKAGLWTIEWNTLKYINYRHGEHVSAELLQHVLLSTESDIRCVRLHLYLDSQLYIINKLELNIYKLTNPTSDLIVTRDHSGVRRAR
jgi:hypothetical protein